MVDGVMIRGFLSLSVDDCNSFDIIKDLIFHKISMTCLFFPWTP